MRKKKLYTCGEAAAHFDEISEYMIRKYIKVGKIEPVVIGRKLFVTLDAVYNSVYGHHDAKGKSSEKKVCESSKKGLDKR